MAIRTITHDDHAHTVKVTTGDIFGIKINDDDKDKISEAFGWDDEKFEQVLKTLRNYQKFVHAAEELNHDLPMSTKNSIFFDFLKSDNFKALGVKIETPNDFFMLGFIYSSVFTASEMMGAVSALPAGALVGLLDHLRKQQK